MIREEYLKKIGIDENDASCIIELNTKYFGRIKPFVEEYVSYIPEEFLSYYKEGQRAETEKRTTAFTDAVESELSELNKYTARLLGWLNCIPYLHERYRKHNISDEIFYDTMKDFSYKIRECQDVYNVIGLFVNWFFIFFDMQIVALGRLQYHINVFLNDEYSQSGYTLKKGDRVYACHIPSSGKLTPEMCMDSLHRAYEFFKPNLKDDILPVVCNTWLFYNPYKEVFPKESNLSKFVNLFDIISNKSSGNEFGDFWRIFNRVEIGNPDELPEDSSLRRNFKNYIKKGGDFGSGYGVLLYNGVTGEIINRQSEE